MGIAYSNERRTRLAARALLLLSFSLGGCATSTTGSSLMDARAEVAAPPKTSAYLPVEDMPPDRQTPTMTTDETSKLKKELIAARDHQAAAVKGRKAPNRLSPQSSSKTILTGGVACITRSFPVAG